ncbi:phage antirepressor N-terminal domain-containing protein [Acinetobacter sp. ANC 4640]
MTSLALRPQVVKFNNQDVPVFFHENKPYVAMKPICENIGLDWAAQAQKIKRHYVLNSTMVMITKVAQDGKNREMAALPIGYLNGWLMSVDVNRVKPEIKDTLIKYQLECYDVLYNHFMPKVAEAHPNTITTEQQQQIKDAVFAKVYRDGRTYQAVYSEFYREFNIPRYQELPISKFEDALKWLNEGFYSPKAKNLDDDVYNLIYKFVEAVFIENDEMKRICQAIKLINEPSFNQYAHYIVRSNELARKVSWHFNFMNKFDEPLIDRNCRYVSLSGGKKIAVNPNWYNCEA